MGMKAGDCWISPAGSIIPLVDGGHIETVWSQPEKFGYKPGDVETIYKKHNEIVGTDGNARDEIMIKLWKDGFMRVNYNPKNDTFIINCWGIKLPVLKTFAAAAIHGSLGMKVYGGTEVVLSDASSKTYKRTDITGLLSGYGVAKLTMRTISS